MEINKAFLLSILNTVHDHITVVDSEFVIVYTNKSWVDYGVQNGVEHQRWEGINYLTICENSANRGDTHSAHVVEKIRALLAGEINDYYMEYPCNSDSQSKWFSMQIQRFTLDSDTFYVISHKDITQRVEAEFEARRLATTDELTQIANRRTFQNFAKAEFQRCKRHQYPLSLAMIDLDDFKLINDTYGHQVGDKCLKKTAELLTKYTSRPSDLCARYGGEEFIIIWGELPCNEALMLLEKFLMAFNQIAIEDEHGNCVGYLRASIGLSTIVPENQSVDCLIANADRLLYQAKGSGKNQICHDIDFEKVLLPPLS